MPTASQLEVARDLLHFIEASATPYHAVSQAAQRLAAAGFERLDERQPWALAPGAKHYVVRAGGTLIAFEVGIEPPPASGFLVVGAHTDSPNLRLKPNAEWEASGYLQLAVEIYGGVLLHTWLDRDLALAGRVVTGDGRAHLLALRDEICRVPSLAIHLDRDVNTAGLRPNPQTQLVPLRGLALEGTPALLERIAGQLETPGGPAYRQEDIVGFDLCLHALEPPRIAGASDEFLLAPRLDNLASCHAGLCALARCKSPHAATRVLALYDHEEVGSRSAAGAQSRVLLSVLERIVEAQSGPGAEPSARALARSMMISADMAHAIHPSYSDKHDAQHPVFLNRGPVLKTHASQSYATDGPAAAAFAAACGRVGAPYQKFVGRNDIPCGSTIGPISAARLAIRTVDVGNPMLSMHSAREMAGTEDAHTLAAVLTDWWHNATPPGPEL